jgi:hypothetical protein
MVSIYWYISQLLYALSSHTRYVLAPSNSFLVIQTGPNAECTNYATPYEYFAFFTASLQSTQNYVEFGMGTKVGFTVVTSVKAATLLCP